MNDDTMTILSDDGDMKIAGDTFDEPIPDAAAQTEALYEQQRQNGNLGRAAALGTRLAKEFLDAETGEDAASIQRQLLIAFAVETALDAALPNRLLKPVARAAWRDGIRTLPATVQAASNPSGAYTFYYLCLHEHDGVADRIGETYASLCGKKNDAESVAQGKKLYLGTRDAVIKAVATAGLCE